MGSLQLPKPAKTLSVHLLLEPVLYSGWPQPKKKLFVLPKLFTWQYPNEEGFLQKLIVPVEDPPIIMVQVEDNIGLVDKRFLLA